MPAPNTYSVPPVMGRGQPWFPEDPGCTAAMVRDQYYSYMRDLARTPGPAAHKVINPDVSKLNRFNNILFCLPACMAQQGDVHIPINSFFNGACIATL